MKLLALISLYFLCGLCEPCPIDSVETELNSTSSPTTSPIAYEKDRCAHCDQIIWNVRFGAKIVTETGTLSFDGLECLARYETEFSPKGNVFVVDFAASKTLIPREKAIILHSELLKSPGKMNLSAFSNEKEADKLQAVYLGEYIGWETARQRVVQNIKKPVNKNKTGNTSKV